MTQERVQRKNDWPATWRALMKLRNDPDNTDAVFEIFEALPGRGIDKGLQAFKGCEVGSRVLREERVLLDKLSDRTWLESLPEGSLGRTYFDFTAREKLTADGLVEASESQSSKRRHEDPEARLYYNRLRDMHDLEHVTTGYGRDLVGEAAILTFDLSQRWYAGLAVICLLAWVEGSHETRTTQRGAWRRGKKAMWLALADWERHLEEPLSQVRQELGLGDPPRYEAARSAGAPDIAHASTG